MKERPILFSGPMVRALLDGRKTQTRRIINPQPNDPSTFGTSPVWGYGTHTAGEHAGFYCLHAAFNEGGKRVDRHLRCPYGAPGDRLWVRETFAELLAVSPASDQPIPIGPGERLIEAPTSYNDANGKQRWNYDGRVLAYRANSNIEFCDGDGFSGSSANRDDMPKWRPSIFMPRWASRLTLEVVAVRVERLNDISEADALAEGISTDPATIRAANYKPVNAYRALWESINGPGSWAANPWVWVVEFRRMTERGSAEMAPAAALAGASPEPGSEGERVNLTGCPSGGQENK